MTKYSKTAKGHEEIAERRAGLGLRARRLLILIDGRREPAELARLAGDANIDQTLHALVEGGFIQTASAPVAQAVAAAPVPTQAARSARTASLALAQDFMMNTLRTFHGPYGKLDLVKRIHASSSAEDLRTLVDEWQHSINESRIGRKRADELLARLREVMPA
ncbi:MAG: hypothetical protein L6Q70_11920 [Thauera sp.]|jgi:hypothetical protein|nr:hypothetical protein [Thauera sp.]